MQLLIGYLVALSVFLGGGYAGVQWLLAPDEPAAAVGDGSRAASASRSRAINAKKLREARALHRKVAESLAEDGVKPAPAAVEDGDDRSVKIADPSNARAAADASTDAARPHVPDTAVLAHDPKLDARAEISAVGTPEKIKAVHKESDAQQRPAGKADSARVTPRKPPEIKAGPASEPAAGHSEVPIAKKQAVRKQAVNKKEAVSKNRRGERFASSSRKPVMMILRTIEFPDGRREQRLLPMTQARSGLAGYGSVSAFADDDDF
ncbi:hypothetical protein [Bradyrhizobium sp.]|jgi:hypothetical protein|uniref:hypothetical protein n=1 Tax=Bradyrhizobium sp. TaxID=376 RepID=UPI002E05722C|nr:hypothetical protein [Bradyrhizobium sp.]